MALNVIHDSIDDIPEAFRELYTEREGKHVLTGIGGVKTQEDIDRIHGGLTKEREEHQATREKLAQWRDLDHDDVIAKLDRFKELEIAAKGNKEEMDAKLEELTEARIGSRLAPVERENRTLKENLEKATTQLEAMKASEKRRTITDEVMTVAGEMKVISGALDDMKLLAGAVFEVTEDGKVLTKENDFGITPGLSPDVWLQEMQDKRPHWWPPSEGGGSKGSGGVSLGGKTNPWSRDGWNITEQAKIIREHGEEKAKQLAKSVGATLTTRPAAKS